VLSTIDLRLEDNEVNWSGRLEVQYNGVWGTICDDKFDNTDASVACKQLGLGYVYLRCQKYVHGTHNNNLLIMVLTQGYTNINLTK